MAANLFYSLVFGSSLLLFSHFNDKFIQKDLKESFKYDNNDNPVIDALPKIKEYDFIVCGVGTAGSVVVNKLSEKYSVLALEAGGDPIPLTSIPIYYHFTLNSTITTHQWTSIKQNYSSLAIDNGQIYIAQGKGLGGSTVINGMSYNRGNPKDYQLWAEISGDESWSYESLLPHFKATENFYQEQKTDHLGFDGPLFISKNEDVLNEEGLELFENWKKAGEELGFKIFENSNAPQTEGFGTLSQTKKNGRRVTAYDAFIKPILFRNSLTISKYSEVQAVDVDENERAVGVLYKKHGVFHYAKAKKEVILSAGAMNSPLLLMKSGIGPKVDLEAAGIKVKIDLPVGQKFQDHPSFFFHGFKLGEEYYKNLDAEKELKNFAEGGKGPLANGYEIYAQSFIVSSQAKLEGDGDYPDIQFIAGVNSSHLVKGDNSAFIYIALVRPSSYGYLKIDSKGEKLIWNPNYLSEERDVKVLAEGMKIASKLVETESFRKNKGEVVKHIIPECKEYEYGTDDYFTCYIKHMTITIWHPTTTCKMSKKDDPFMVVDSQLRVKGVENLRVIDNSIQPKLMNANTMSPAYLIGQKGADMILKKYENEE